MEPGSRAEKNSLAFLDHLAGVGGYTLRPPGYLTLEQVGLLELRLVRGKDEYEALSASEKLDEIHAYLFVQAAPLPTVSRAVRSFRKARAALPRDEAFEEFMVNHVEPFLATLTPDIKAELKEQLGQLDEIEAARVDAEPPPGPATRTIEPPNS